MKVAIFAGAMIGAAMLLSGCDNKDTTTYRSEPVYQQQQPVVYEEAPQQQPNVVVVQQPPSYSHSGGLTAGHVAAGALGYMAGKHLNSGPRSSSMRPSREVHHHYYSAPKKSRYFGSSSRSRRRR